MYVCIFLMEGTRDWFCVFLCNSERSLSVHPSSDLPMSEEAALDIMCETCVMINKWMSKIQMIRKAPSIELILMERKLILQALSCLVFSAEAQSIYWVAKAQWSRNVMRVHKWKVWLSVAWKILPHINIREDI